MEVRTLLNEQELALIQRRSNLKASALVTLNYALTASVFSIMVLWTNPITIVLGIILLGTRQLGFGVMFHVVAYPQRTKHELVKPVRRDGARIFSGVPIA